MTLEDTNVDSLANSGTLRVDQDGGETQLRWTRDEI